ncbi:MAG TPA: class I SAM-dependent methyltransferase [Mycobacteriales bacterium]|nr:class I SAM-dependent methyltransferase [Mycobacteriales bacterium]
MTESAELPEHAQRNRQYWDDMADSWVEPGRRNWAATDPTWGSWSIPESELRLLPEDLTGQDTIELGCGTAYFSAWLARRGANAVGIDNSAAQLATARAFQQEFGLEFPLVHGNAEHVPYPDASFDLALSEYGAAIWCDPYEWVPEAARLLRPGGRLIFLGNHTLLQLCSPDTAVPEPAADRLVRDYFGLHRMEWISDDSVEFALPYGEWFRLLRACGFEIEDFLELQAPVDGTRDFDYVTAAWARRWPSEHVFKAVKRG